MVVRLGKAGILPGELRSSIKILRRRLVAVAAALSFRICSISRGVNERTKLGHRHLGGAHVKGFPDTSAVCGSCPVVLAVASFLLRRRVEHFLRDLVDTHAAFPGLDTDEFHVE